MIPVGVSLMALLSGANFALPIVNRQELPLGIVS
jgi:hypothetical protein